MGSVNRAFECRWHWQWHSAWAISLVAVVIVVLGGASTLAASNDSMPGSRLYPVKLAAERVQLALTPGEMARTELNAKFADRRTEEIIYAASKGNAQEVQIVASRLNVNLSNITELAADNAHPGSKPAVEPTALKAPQATIPAEKAPQPLKGPVAAPPPGAKPGLPPAATPPAKARSAAPPAAPPAAPLAAALAAQSPENATTQDVKGLPSEKDVVTHSAKYEAMKKIVQDNFEKRSQKLEETLKNASPAVRPAIRQAIAQSDLEYERTLKNLEETDKSGNAGNSDDSKNSKEPLKTPNRPPMPD